MNFAATPPEEDEARELTILIGIGAAFGAGDPDYLDASALHPFDGALLQFGTE